LKQKLIKSADEIARQFQHGHKGIRSLPVVKKVPTTGKRCRIFWFFIPP